MLEGRAAVADGSKCITVGTAACHRYFMVDAPKQVFTPCRVSHNQCLGGTPLLGCGIEAGLARLADLRTRLQLRSAHLQNYSAPALLEEATIAMSATFEAAIQSDAAVSADAMEAMLRYQVETRRASKHGWADGPFSLRQIGEQIVYNEIASMETILLRDLHASDVRIAQLDTSHGWGTPRAHLPPSDLRGAATVAGGYLFDTRHVLSSSKTHLLDNKSLPVAYMMEPPADDPPLIVAGESSSSEALVSFAPTCATVACFLYPIATPDRHTLPIAAPHRCSSLIRH